MTVLSEHHLQQGILIHPEAAFTVAVRRWSKELLWKQSFSSGNVLQALQRTSQSLFAT
jgi:hypothetical protein